ncbi:hypothetical protein HK096_005280, partial [Nowakowskiella sp. JEL0078]
MKALEEKETELKRSFQEKNENLVKSFEEKESFLLRELSDKEKVLIERELKLASDFQQKETELSDLFQQREAELIKSYNDKLATLSINSQKKEEELIGNDTFKQQNSVESGGSSSETSPVHTLDAPTLPSYEDSSSAIRIEDLQSEIVRLTEKIMTYELASEVTPELAATKIFSTLEEKSIDENDNTELKNIIFEINQKVIIANKQIAESDMKFSEVQIRLLESNQQLLETQNLNIELETKIQGIEATLAENNALLAVMESQSNEIQSELKVNQNQLSEKQTKIKDLENAITIQYTQGQSLEQELQEAKLKNSMLERQNSALESANSRVASGLEATLASRQEHIDELELTLAEVRERVFELETQLEARPTVSIITVEEKDRLLIANQFLQTEVDAHQNTVKALEDDLRITSEQNESYKRELDTVGVELDIVQKNFAEEVATGQERVAKHNEMLSVLKDELHSRDAEVDTIKNELEKVRKQLREEEERKAKSIHLLRNSKTRILKLETDLKQSNLENEKMNAQLNESSQQYTTQTNEFYAKQANLTLQLQTLQSAYELLESKNNSNESTLQSLQQAHHELQEQLAVSLQSQQSSQLLQSELRQQGDQLSYTHARLLESDERITELEADLATSKRLFQTKAAENESLRIRVSKLEADVYAADAKFEHERDAALERETIEREALRVVENSRRALKALEGEKEIWITERLDLNTRLDTLKLEREREKKENGIAMERVLELEVELGALMMKMDVEAEKNKSLEEKLANLQEELEIKRKSVELNVEEAKTKENQLRNVNKALKEEVRKLSRQSTQLLPSSSAASLRASVVSPTGTILGLHNSIPTSSSSIQLASSAPILQSQTTQ